MADDRGSWLTTARAMFETLQISWPTVLDGLAHRVTVDKCDQRLASWAQRLMAQANVDLIVRGARQVDWSRAYVIMSNHQSHYDIPILYAVLRSTVRMVTKQELFRVPIWGRAMRDAGFIAIDRKHRERAISSMREAAEAVRRGVNVWIAPEGTRSRSGDLLPFKKGGFIVARDLEAPILPVAIDGSREVLPAGSWRVRSGKQVRVTFGAPIAVGGRSIEELMDAVRGYLTRTLSSRG